MFDTAILAALQKFADAVITKMKALTKGDPEEQLRGPFEACMDEIGKALELNVTYVGETRLAEHLGKPDYAILFITAGVVRRRL